jgi:hypothetical protein
MLWLFLLAALGGPPSREVSEAFVPIGPAVRLHYRKVGSGKNAVVVPMGSWLEAPLASLAREVSPPTAFRCPGLRSSR